ncbi:MAG: PorT family protein, partial [Prevotella sp.]|nr:PorT family protein [Prevotella sp.]
VGLNVAQMTNADGADARIGVVVGAEFDYQITDMFAVTAGAQYAQQGCKVDADFFDATVKLDYINIPILANFYVVDGFALKIGIQPGFRVSDKVKAEGDGVSVEIDAEDVFGGSTLKDVDFSIPVGASYEFNNVKFDVRYNFGVSPVVKEFGESSKNSVFQFTVGYKFAL